MGLSGNQLLNSRKVLVGDLAVRPMICRLLRFS